MGNNNISTYGIEWVMPFCVVELMVAWGGYRDGVIGLEVEGWRLCA